MVSKIKFKNFKLFKEGTLEIKPITILIGKNNSGKSAVLKLPTLIAGSLSGEFKQPFDNEYEGVRIGLNPEDAFYNREITNDSLDFEVFEDDNSIVKASIIGDINNNIRLRSLVVENEGVDLKSIKTKGFVPEGKSFDKINFDYIEAFRNMPTPQFQKKTSEIVKVGLNGENAFSLFAKYYDEKNPVYKLISDWYFKNFENWKLEVNQIPSSVISYEITLRNGINKPINIVNTGSGISQSFPLILRSFMPVVEPTLIIIEEPETHLHPAAHGNLAERFVDSYLEDKSRSYLIETHSENFILRLQSLIADPEIQLSNNDVKIYYVDFDENELYSKITPLEISIDGEIEDWPDNVFNENLDEVYKLRRNQKKRIK